MDDAIPRPGDVVGEPCVATAAPVACLEEREPGLVRIYLIDGRWQDLDVETRSLGPPQENQLSRFGGLSARFGVCARGGARLTFGMARLGRGGLRWERGGEVHALEVAGRPGVLLGVAPGVLLVGDGVEVLLLEVPGGSVRLRLGGPERPIQGAALSPGGGALVIQRGAALEWRDPGTGDLVAGPVPVPPEASWLAGPAPGGEVALRLEGEGPGRLRVYGPEGPLGPAADDPGGPTLGRNALSPCGRRLLRLTPALRECGGGIEYDVVTGTATPLDLPSEEIGGVWFGSYGADGRRRFVHATFLRTGGGILTLHDDPRGEPVAQVRLEGYPYHRWEGEELWVLSPCQDGLRTQRVHPPAEAPPVRFEDEAEGRGHCVYLAGAGGFLVHSDLAGYRFLPAEGGEGWTLPGPFSRTVASADLTPDGARVAALLWPAEVAIWDSPHDPPTLHPVGSLVPFLAGVRWAPDGVGLLRVYANHLELGPPGESSETFELGSEPFRYGIEADPDGHGFRVGGPQPAIWVPGDDPRSRDEPPASRMLRLADGRELSVGVHSVWLHRGGVVASGWPRDVRAGARALAVDGSGRRLAWLTEAEEIRIVDPHTGLDLDVIPKRATDTMALALDRARDLLWVLDCESQLWSYSLDQPGEDPERVTQVSCGYRLEALPGGGVLVRDGAGTTRVTPGWWGWRCRHQSDDALTTPPAIPQGISEWELLLEAPGEEPRGLLGGMGTALRWYVGDEITTLENPHDATVTAACIDDRGQLYTAAANGTLVVWRS
jgi:hypothetical protein